MKILLLALGIISTPLMAQSALTPFKEDTCDKVLNYGIKAIGLPFNCLNAALKSPVGKALRIGMVAASAAVLARAAQVIYHQYKDEKPHWREEEKYLAYTVIMYYLTFSGACGLFGYAALTI